MTTAQLAVDDVATLNLLALLSVRSWAAKDPVLASYMFSIPADEVERFAAMSIDAVRAIASRVDRAVFTISVPAGDLLELADLPASFAAMLAGSRLPEPTSAVAG